MSAFKKGIKRGFYEPIFPEKWVITKSFDEKRKGIKFRSSWERKFCEFCDFNDNIIKVNSEGIVVPYVSPIDNKQHRYFVDFIIKTKSDVYLIEIKPFKDTIAPVQPKKTTESSSINFKKAIDTFVVNTAKWQAATEFAKERKFKFMIITERELFN